MIKFGQYQNQNYLTQLLIVFEKTWYIYCTWKTEKGDF